MSSVNNPKVKKEAIKLANEKLVDAFQDMYVKSGNNPSFNVDGENYTLSAYTDGDGVLITVLDDNGDYTDILFKPQG